MINTQREKLIREFHLYVDQPETCLAALHAVSVYQILSSLDDRSTTTGPVEVDRPQTGSGLAAEFHISFLLKEHPIFFHPSHFEEIFLWQLGSLTKF